GGYELGNVEPKQPRDRVAEMTRILGGVRTRDADVGPAAKVDPAHFADVERRHVVDVALHDPLEPVPHPEHIHGLEPRPDRGGPDDAVDPRRGPAPDQDRQRLPLRHRFPFTRGSWDPLMVNRTSRRPRDTPPSPRPR